MVAFYLSKYHQTVNLQTVLAKSILLLLLLLLLLLFMTFTNMITVWGSHGVGGCNVGGLRRGGVAEWLSCGVDGCVVAELQCG